MKSLLAIFCLRSIARIMVLFAIMQPICGHAQIKPMVKKGQTRAVVIGVAKYQNPNITALQFTDADAKAFAKYLRSPAGGAIAEENIKLLTNEQATQGQMAMALTWLMQESQEGDQAIIYFSGHGDVETTTMMNFGYLLTYDAPASTYMAGGAFPINYLEAIVQTLTAQKNVAVLLITDACHAGKLAGSAVNGTQATAQALTAQFANAAKILSCQPNELSQESTIWGGGHSVFTYYLIDGLIGLADNNHDNKVSMLEIRRYLEDNVPPAVAPKSQIPLISGNMALHLSTVDPKSLAALIASRKNPTEVATADVALKAGGKETVKPADTLTMARFRQALKDKHLLYPKEGSAYALYQLIKSKSDIADAQNQMRNDLVAGLQDEAQQAINAYLAGNPQELKRRWSYDTTYLHYPEYLAKAAEIVGPQHFLYTDLKAKQLYFEGLNMRLAAEQDKNNVAGFDNAIQRQELVLSLAPNAAYAYNELGLLSRRKKAYEKSLEYFNKAIELTPTWAMAQTNLCAIYNDLDQYDNAILHCNLALAADSSFALAWHNRGVVFDAKGDFPQAINCFNKALSFDPDYPTTYYMLGNAYYLSGNKEKAEENWNRCIQLDPKGRFSSTSWNNLAEIAAENNDFKAALERFDQAIAVKPDYVLALFGKAKTLGALGKKEASLEVLAIALEKGFKIKDDILSAPELEKVRAMDTFSALMKRYFPE